MEQVQDVLQALETLGHEVSTMAIGEDPIREIAALTNSKVDLVFNLCESIRENSKLQASFTGVLELLGIPFTGSGTEGIMTAINKYKTKAILFRHGISTPEGWLIQKSDTAHTVANTINRIPETLYPVIVKPNMENGSIGLHQGSVAKTPEELREILKESQKEHEYGLLIEQYIDGREFNVGFIGRDRLTPLSVAEIKFKPSFSGQYKFLSYDAKWSSESGEFGQYERVSPPDLPDRTIMQILKLGQAAYKGIGLSGYGRIDFRMDENECPYVIDVNANPDLSKEAGLAKGAMESGLSYVQLIDMITKHPYRLYDRRKVKKRKSETSA